MQNIRIRGARTHNLKNIDLDLPRDRLIVLTGLSGSGKSSLAFDTIYAEGQRRYVESLSTYARQFLSMMEKPDVDTIEGLSPAISIEQKSTSHNPRSTVGTVTEVYDYLRLLYARAGTPRCPDHHIDLAAQTVSQMVDAVLEHPEGTALMLLAPAISERKGEHAELIEELQAGGFVRARIDGEVVELDQAPKLDVRRKHTVEAIVDRFRVRPDLGQRLAESFETALRLGSGVARVAYMDDPKRAELVFSNKFACPICNYSLSELEPRLFSFNSPDRRLPELRRPRHPGVLRSREDRRQSASVARRRRGARLGSAQRLLLSADPIAGAAHEVRHRGAVREPAAADQGSGAVRQRRGADRVQVSRRQGRHGQAQAQPSKASSTIWSAATGKPNRRPCARSSPSTARRAPAPSAAAPGSTAPRATCSSTARTPPEVSSLTVDRAVAFFAELKLPGWRGEIAVKIVKEIGDRLGFLANVGLGYLTLDRSADTLSGGEAQRIRLASQIGSGLVGVMYILDEPSIGLHQRDNQRLLDTLVNLRDLGNTVIVVEHDEDAIRQADYVVDLGPGAGVHGGEIVAQGTAAEVAAHPDSITGQYLSGRRRIEIPPMRRSPDPKRMLRLIGRHRQQPEERHGGVSARADDLRHRRLRLRQIDAGQRHLVPRGRNAAQPRRRRQRAFRAHRRPRPHRSGDRDRSEPDRPHAALQSRHLHRPVRAHPRDLRRPCRNPARAATRRAASASTSKAAAARPARATASSRSRCIFSPTSTCPATSAGASATTARPWRSASRARTSRKCST